MPLDRLVPELYCADLKKSLDFYVKALGFKVLYERTEERFAYLERESVHLMLEELGSGGREWITGELKPPFGRGVNFQIPVSDATQLHNNLQKLGYSLFLPLEEKWYRRDKLQVGNRQFIVQDPDGYLLCFAQDLGSRPV